MKERLKNYLAYIITFLIVIIGSACLLTYFKEIQNAGITIVTFMSAFGVILVFHPVIDYWLAIVKKALKIENND